MILKRYAEETLEKWFNLPGRKPLVIRGARQVGKSTLIRAFAEQKKLKLYEINLERHPGFNDLFRSMDPNRILTEIEYFTGLGRINPEKSLLFLDEIQAAPEALKALRYFHEEKAEIPLVAAGSLLEFTLADHSFSMPVGRIEYLFLGPMVFEEYLEAKGEAQLLELIRTFDFSSFFPESAHQRLLKIQREYLLVGGMPEAVNEYLSTGRMEDVNRIHSSITETYRDDFSKYAKSVDLIRIQKVYDYVPLAVGEKIKYSQIDPDILARDHKKAIDLLSKARVIARVHHSHASGLPIKAGQNDKVFKLYFLDIGLMNRMAGIDHLPLASLERGVEFINKGKMAEQFIAQHLLQLGQSGETPSLHYWLREGRSSNAEVDFVISTANTIVPVEVKAGKSGTIKSLQQFIFEKKSPVALRFDLNPPGEMIAQHRMTRHQAKLPLSYHLISLPLYMVGQCYRLISKKIRS